MANNSNNMDASELPEKLSQTLLEYGMQVDVDTEAKNATYIPSLGLEDIDKKFEQKIDDEAMFELDVSRGK